MSGKEKNEHILSTQLEEYCEKGKYPMHMPGHKRNLAPAPGLPYTWDVTEVQGTDDLHDAQGILKDAMERTSRLFGSFRTWYLVNGSTCGILASLYAVVPYGGEVIIARNCHKSVFHAMELMNLTVHWLMPTYLSSWDICGAIQIPELRRLLHQYPKTKAVVLTSPTYEGVISDIEGAAKEVHEAGAILIVDEAHGAHLGLFLDEKNERKDKDHPSPDCFPDSAVHLGADIVIQSPHKTLPSLTQTALLHLCTPDRAVTQTTSEQISCLAENLEHALDIFETSSPSYPLMASLDGCTGILENRGEELFAAWRCEINRTNETIASLHYLNALQGDVNSGKDIYQYDDSRFLLRAGKEAGLSGKELALFLSDTCGIEPEMYCGKNVLLMSGCGDSKEGWDKTRKALMALDVWLGEKIRGNSRKISQQNHAKDQGRLNLEKGLKEERPYLAPEIRINSAKAHALILQGKTKESSLILAENLVSAEYVMAYPPGIPILIPGEQIRAQEIQLLRELEKEGANLVFSMTTQTQGKLRIRILVDPPLS